MSRRALAIAGTLAVAAACYVLLIWLPRWTSLGGVITGGLNALRNADGRLEAFTRGTDGALWHIWQTAPKRPPAPEAPQTAAR